MGRLGPAHGGSHSPEQPPQALHMAGACCVSAIPDHQWSASPADQGAEGGCGPGSGSGGRGLEGQQGRGRQGSPGPARPPQAGAIRGFRQRSSSRRRAGSGQGRGRRRVAASTSRGWSGAQVTCGGRARAADSQPWGLVLLKVTSMGKFHTSARLASRLLDVIWEMPSSRPCEDRDGDAGGPAPGVETCLPPAKEAEGRGAAARLSSLRATWPCARVPPRLRGVGCPPQPVPASCLLCPPPQLVPSKASSKRCGHAPAPVPSRPFVPEPTAP